MTYQNECPKCESTQVKRGNLKAPRFYWFWVMVNLGLPIIFYPLWPRHKRCEECGLKWKV
jgi:hypothetical protein